MLDLYYWHLIEHNFDSAIGVQDPRRFPKSSHSTRNFTQAVALSLSLYVMSCWYFADFLCAREYANLHSWILSCRRNPHMQTQFHARSAT